MPKPRDQKFVWLGIPLKANVFAASQPRALSGLCTDNPTKKFPKTARIPWQPFHNRTPAIEAPPGFTFLTGDAYPPGATVENRVDIFRNGFTGGWFNTVYAKAHERGGHFGPWENPDAFIEGIRETFRLVRSQSRRSA